MRQRMRIGIQQLGKYFYVFPAQPSEKAEANCCGTIMIHKYNL